MNRNITTYHISPYLHNVNSFKLHYLRQNQENQENCDILYRKYHDIKLCKLTEKGDLRGLKWRYQHRQFSLYIEKTDRYQMINDNLIDDNLLFLAMKHNNLNIIKWLLSNKNTENIIIIFYQETNVFNHTKTMSMHQIKLSEFRSFIEKNILKVTLGLFDEAITRSDNIEIFKYLINRCDKNLQEIILNDGIYLIRSAIMKNRFDIVKYILRIYQIKHNTYIDKYNNCEFLQCENCIHTLKLYKTVLEGVIYCENDTIKPIILWVIRKITKMNQHNIFDTKFKFNIIDIIHHRNYQEKQILFFKELFENKIAIFSLDTFKTVITSCINIICELFIENIKYMIEYQPLKVDSINNDFYKDILIYFFNDLQFSNDSINIHNINNRNNIGNKNIYCDPLKIVKLIVKNEHFSYIFTDDEFLTSIIFILFKRTHQTCYELFAKCDIIIFFLKMIKNKKLYKNVFDYLNNTNNLSRNEILFSLSINSVARGDGQLEKSQMCHKYILSIMDIITPYI